MAEAASLTALASRFIETESVPWIEMAPGNKMKVIYHDPVTDMLTILSKLEPGAGIPAHVHEDLEQTFVLEGSLVDHEGECTAGNFVIRAKGSRHAADGAQRLHHAGVLPQAHGGAGSRRSSSTPDPARAHGGSRQPVARIEPKARLRASSTRLRRVYAGL